MNYKTLELQLPMSSGIWYISKELVTRKCHANQVVYSEWILPLYNLTIYVLKRTSNNLKETYSLLNDNEQNNINAHI